MQDKPLDRTEQELLAVIERMFAAGGPVDRNRLSVEARGKGLEVSRPLARLKALGLVEEYDRKPFVLWRIFGAKTVTLLRPVVPVAETPAPDAAPETVAEVAAETPVIETAAPVIDAEPPVPEPVVELAPIPAPEPLPIPEPLPEPPVTEPESLPEPDPAPKPIELAPGLIVDAAPLPASAPRPAPPKPVRTPVGFAEDLGGAPMAMAAPPAAIDPDVMDGLRETLQVLGFELTIAGEALIAHRMGKGATAGEALCQVVLFAVAHALRHDTDGEIQAMGLEDYTIEVMHELEKLRDAGEIGPQPFEADMRALWSLVRESEDRIAFADQLLLDPVGGAAPPALLPEDLRRPDA